MLWLLITVGAACFGIGVVVGLMVATAAFVIHLKWESEVAQHRGHWEEPRYDATEA